MKLIHIQYMSPTGWALPLLGEAHKHECFKPALAAWRDSDLSSLAFSIDLRRLHIGALSRRVEATLPAITAYIASKFQPSRHLGADPYALDLEDQRARWDLARDLSGLVTEQRSLFENVAEFNRLFREAFFGKKITARGPDGKELAAKPASFVTVESLAPPTGWANELRESRCSLLHDYSPMIDFEVLDEGERAFAPVLRLKWQPERNTAADVVRYSTILDTNARLGTALEACRAALFNELKKAGSSG